MKGAELAVRFSYITNALDFCGPSEASKHFLRYIKEKNNEKNVVKSIKNFEGLYPYLSYIAEKTNKNFLDYDVVESYWIGNKLLGNFNDGDIKKIIGKLMQSGLPKSIGNKLIERLPHGFVPHHNFNVFYVGVGNITGAVETTLQNMDNCRIGWGKVMKILNNELTVSTQSLKKEKNKFVLSQDVKTVVYLPEMLSNVKKDDFVAVHWGFAPLILEENQQKNLKHYTKKILDIMNEN